MDETRSTAIVLPCYSNVYTLSFQESFASHIVAVDTSLPGCNPENDHFSIAILLMLSCDCNGALMEYTK